MCMICSILLTVVLGVQPVCTKSTFSQFVEPSLHGDTKVVARAIFDDYLEQVQKLDSGHTERQTPIEFVIEQREKEIQADFLLDSFLDSLTVLDGDSNWLDVIKQLRRIVLLNARESNNPWPATRWDDIARTVQTNQKFLDNVDSFLLRYVDVDRNDRFVAIIAKLEGDKEGCVQAERRTMQRWAIYNALIEPYENESSLALRYPTIHWVEKVTHVKFRIVDKIKDTAQADAVGNLFTLYRAVHKKRVRDVVELIKNTRINDGIDPLSLGCGSGGKTRNLILQRNAELQELETATIESMLQVLTPEQRQQLDLDG